MKKAYLYIRFSTKKQEEGDSIRRQVEAAKRWCQLNDAELSEQTFEDLGVSGFLEGGDRPALADLIEAITIGKIPRGSYILFEDTDRLTRQGYQHALALVQEIVNLDATLIIVSSGQCVDKKTIRNISPMLPMLLDADRAFLESERKSQLIRAAKAKVRDNNEIVGKMPFWIDLIDGKPNLNDKTGVVRRIVELRQKGRSYSWIARDLNQSGVPSANGVQWNASAIRVVCTNHALYGAKAYHITTGKRKMELDKIVLGLFPVVIDKATFDSIQAKKGTKGRVSRISPFSGFFRCAECGSGMVQRTSTYKERKLVYRRCIKSLDGACTQTKQIREPDSIMLSVLHDMKYVSGSASQHVSRLAELVAKKQSMEAVVDSLLEKGLVDAVSNTYTKMAEIDNEIVLAKKEDEQADVQDDDFDYKCIFELNDIEEQYQKLRTVVDRIEIRYMGVIDKKTSSRWRVTTYQRNGHRVAFTLNSKHGFGNNEVKWVSDTGKLKDHIKHLTADIEDFEE